MRQGKYKCLNGKFVHENDVGSHGLRYEDVGACVLIGLLIFMGMWVAAIFV
jgi:hypothetical protein